MKTWRDAGRPLLALLLAAAAACTGNSATSRPALTGAAGEVPSAEYGVWRHAHPGYSWQFPRDHWAHRDFRNEWWYLTGHLHAVSEPSRRFGYQFTIFRIGILPAAPEFDSEWASAGLLMGHAAITDLAAGEHIFSEVLLREVPLLSGFGEWPEPTIAWTRAPAGTDGRWSLAWNGEAFDISMVDRRRGLALELSTRPEKPLVLQGPGGFSRKAPSGLAASQYYSFTRLASAGRLTVGGRTWAVEGRSWMDREFASSQLSAQQVGWDWFSLQLDDGREAMLYLLRRADGSVDFAQATLVAPSGEPLYLAAEDWSVQPLGAWTSPSTGAVYPSGWRVRLPAPGMNLTVTPDLLDQENVCELAGLHYWEGAATVRAVDGAVVGRAYVELTGYGAGNRPPL